MPGLHHRAIIIADICRWNWWDMNRITARIQYRQPVLRRLAIACSATRHHEKLCIQFHNATPPLDVSSCQRKRWWRRCSWQGEGGGQRITLNWGTWYLEYPYDRRRSGEPGQFWAAFWTLGERASARGRGDPEPSTKDPAKSATARDQWDICRATLSIFHLARMRACYRRPLGGNVIGNGTVVRPFRSVDNGHGLFGWRQRCRPWTRFAWVRNQSREAGASLATLVQTRCSDTRCDWNARWLH